MSENTAGRSVSPNPRERDSSPSQRLAGGVPKIEKQQASSGGPKIILHFNTTGTIVMQDRKSEKTIEDTVRLFDQR